MCYLSRLEYNYYKAHCKAKNQNTVKTSLCERVHVRTRTHSETHTHNLDVAFFLLFVRMSSVITSVCLSVCVLGDMDGQFFVFCSLLLGEFQYERYNVGC